MNKVPVHKSNERGTLQSYIVGFILSLALTLIPYYLVKHHSATGMLLLVAILGFALIQLVVQILFFLHLGRGPKPRWNLYFFGATASMILVVVGGSLIIVNNLHHNMAVPDQEKVLINEEAIAQVNGHTTGACQELFRNYQIMLMNGELAPRHTTAAKCDTVSFTNHDSKTHTIIFGTPKHRVTYAGQSTVSIHPHMSETVTLSESGDFSFYDQAQPTVTGTFLVTDQ